MSRVWEMCGVVDMFYRSVGEVEDILDRWNCENKGDIKFTFKAFLNYLKVEQSKKATTESKSKCG